MSATHHPPPHTQTLRVVVVQAGSLKQPILFVYVVGLLLFVCLCCWLVKHIVFSTILVSCNWKQLYKDWLALLLVLWQLLGGNMPSVLWWPCGGHKSALLSIVIRDSSLSTIICVAKTLKKVRHFFNHHWIFKTFGHPLFFNFCPFSPQFWSISFFTSEIWKLNEKNNFCNF